MQTYVLDDISELSEVYESVAEDFNDIDYTDWMVRELDEMARLHAGYFQRQAGPDDAPWAKNAPRTIKEKGHARILRGKPDNNYRLSKSLTLRGTKQSTEDAIRETVQTDTGAYMTFGSAVEYSALHDETRGNIPARRHVGLNEHFVEVMVDRVADYIVRQLAK